METDQVLVSEAQKSLKSLNQPRVNYPVWVFDEAMSARLSHMPCCSLTITKGIKDLF